MFRNIAFAFLFIVLVGPVAGQMPAPAPVPVEQQTKDPAPTREWTNSGAEAMDVDVTDPAWNAVFVQIGRNNKPFRVLLPDKVEGRYLLSVPPKSTVQMWARKDLAQARDHAFSQAAERGVFPRIVVGPFEDYSAGGANAPVVQVAPWRSGLAQYNAYPEGNLVVTVRATNFGTSYWKKPRVRLFAPDNWSVTPAIAPLEVDGGLKMHKRGLNPGYPASARFVVRIPRNTPLNATYPLVAFIRFEADDPAAKTKAPVVTVQNSIDVRVIEPVERRYAMNEAGSLFAVRLMNRFRPATLGNASVEVRSPVGADWTVEQPGPVTIRKDSDARVDVRQNAAATGQVSVPVVVMLNGLRMGYTPIVQVAADFSGGTLRENGLSVLRPAGSTTNSQADGLAFAEEAEQHVLALDVAPRFAVSDPHEWVSPTFVTVRLAAGSDGRVKLEYDAYAEKYVTAADIPLVAGQRDLSFILPDARFQGRLEGGADLRLVFAGGKPVIQSITVSKWNPLAREQ